MDSNYDFGRLWKQIIDENVEDNTEEETMRYLHEVQQQVNNTTHHIRLRRVINWNHEDWRSRLFNDYFFENLVYT